MADRRDFFEELIFRSMGTERFTQDSPILPDVWLAYGQDPRGRLPLLLTPMRGVSPIELARRLKRQLEVEYGTTTVAKKGMWTPVEGEDDDHQRRRLHTQHLEIWPAAPAEVAFHQSAVVADLTFSELVRIVLPMTGWWHRTLVDPDGELADVDEWFRDDPKQFGRDMVTALRNPGYRGWEVGEDGIKSKRITAGLVWLVRMMGTIAWLAERHCRSKAFRDGWAEMSAEDLRTETQDDPDAIKPVRTSNVVDAMRRLMEWSRDHLPTDGGPTDPLVLHVNNNRAGSVSIYDSDKAVKGDAVRQLFSVRGGRMRWAVIDSGIDAGHIAFRKRDANGEPLGPGETPLPFGTMGVIVPEDDDGCRAGGGIIRVTRTNKRTGRRKTEWVNQTRIEATYDFTRLRKLLSADPDELTTTSQDVEIAGIVAQARAIVQQRGDMFRDYQTSLRQSLKFGSQIDWDLLAPLLEVPHDGNYRVPRHHHGTHVAGIIGADWRAGEHSLSPKGDRTGLAPEIGLYDLRALDDGGVGNEFDIMGALQFVRHLNSRKTGPDEMLIHGVNLSFSIRHEVSNYACGRTPVCEEAERLIGDGIVVVAAAGNQGRARYRTATGQDDEGYRSISITDPGNAEGVITVGSTHRKEPHTYGVSYFSSRGPTGDGRRKPDLVAPGEKVYSAVPGQGERDLDGTSMAAPHVSGAAALLMERNSELIGQPQRIKQVLCDSATDLGREPYFQGAGMLDVLRALQST